ncbi:hypothetical protein SK128_006765 [Halocaridina rubra]|uniref:Solute carrier organic anion transporter family member n=1 Tax=Halocaridina rubra TaxID=373956 RepID=A0AAN8X6H7_HALRR
MTDGYVCSLNMEETDHIEKYNRTETVERESKDGTEGKENIPLLLNEKEIVLTKELEEEILGPESFAWCGLGPLTRTLSTVERRFKLPSAASGFISTGNDVLQLFLSLPVAYAAGYGHRPRWLGWGTLLAASGCFFIISPHLIFGAGDYSDLVVNEEYLGHENRTSENHKGWAACRRKNEDAEPSCEEQSSAVGIEQYAVAVLMFLGQLLSGVANLCFYVVGYSYLDEAVSKDKAPLYFAISGCLRIFGPVTGMALSGYAVGKWVELGVEPVIDPSHPRWIGAWWLGYPVIMFFLLMSYLPLMMMPRMLPGMRNRLINKLRAAAKQGKEALAEYRNTLRPIESTHFKEMIPSIKRLSRRKIFVTLLANQTFFWIFMVGYWMFKLKYMEHHFRLSAAEANKTLALSGMLASLIGWLGMGSILTFLKPSSRVIMYITMAISLLCMSTFLGMLFIKCEKDHVIGLETVLQTEGYTGEDQRTDPLVVSSCMSNCTCDAQYSPVCVNKQHLFFSACHAGCNQQLNINGTLGYANCTCGDLQISYEHQESHLQMEESDSPAVIKSGICLTGCDKFLYYVILSTMSQMLVAANRVIANILFFRSTDERDKDMALGILNVILSLAFVIQPVITGGLVDFCCLLWQRTCGRRGYCYLYDINMYNWVLHGLPVVGMFLSFLTESIILQWHEEIDFFGEKEMEQLQILDILKKKKKKEDR